MYEQLHENGGWAVGGLSMYVLMYIRVMYYGFCDYEYIFKSRLEQEAQNTWG